MDDLADEVIVRTRDRVRVTAEIFTPSDLVLEMIQRLPIEAFEPGRTVLDPACGDGQFLIAVKWVKVLYFKMAELDALQDIYGIDIMADNVAACRSRLGGGTIVIGDALNPSRRVPGQTPADRRILHELLSESSQLALFDPQ
jgi:hypothetical protein